ncbi:MAG: DUF3048 C-terminal domain-containing protein [Chloroflexi bacterium]|nr:DUF3048 C-terminal domain-containing protein [Chloroflexota bacterium]
MHRLSILLLSAFCLLASSCQPAPPPSAPPTLTPTHLTPETETLDTVTPSPSPQPHLPPLSLGPEIENFPANINPLTAREVEDASWLKLPAVLVSISNMPVTARPQAGINFASWVFEFYIGEGATRFLSVFYGNGVRDIPNVNAGCATREQIIRPQGEWIGNRVFLDENANGRADDWETGVGGVCVRLLDAARREVLRETTTDANGYYAFDRPSGEVVIQFIVNDKYQFTAPDLGDEDRDSDADPVTGETRPFVADATAPFHDAGVILLDRPIATSSPVVTGTPENWFFPQEPYIGPIRSGRMTYRQVGYMFWNSCLVFASAGRGIIGALDACAVIYGVDENTPNSSLLPVTRLRQLAEDSLVEGHPVNYSGNIFSDAVPEGGKRAIDISVFYHAYTQAAWKYDPISGSYLRWSDMADGKGVPLVPATDRLTGRQQSFENVIVVFAEHMRIRHNQFEIDLGVGKRGYAYLFRDGQYFPIRWATVNREWEKKSGFPRPIYFLDTNNNPIALHPGRTWIHLVTPFSYVEDQSDGQWLIRFVQPADPEDTPSP